MREKTNQITVNATQLTRALVNEIDALASEPNFQIMPGWAKEVQDKHEAPLPWDASFSLEDNDRTLVIEGGAGPMGYGSCVVKLPVLGASEYVIEIEAWDDAKIPASLIIASAAGVKKIPPPPLPGCDPRAEGRLMDSMTSKEKAFPTDDFEGTLAERERAATHPHEYERS